MLMSAIRINKLIRNKCNNILIMKIAIFNMKSIRLFARWALSKTKKSLFIRKGLSHKILYWIGAIVPTVLFVCVALVIYEFALYHFTLTVL